MRYRYIAIEGNIGAGKTTLATLLSEHYGAKLILEEFADNNFLPKFYQDPERYAFPLELSFLADRYKQLQQVLTAGDLFAGRTISDYTFIKCKLFARTNLKEDEYDLFQKLFDIIDLQLPAPDLLIYLNTPIQQLQDNIRKRGRSYEQEIPDSYLEQVENAYQQYLKQHNKPVLIVNTATTDFLARKEHFDQLIDFLDNGPEFTNHRHFSQATSL